MREGNKWYFFSRRAQNRISESGYWQALGVEETIYSSTQLGQRLGTKKYNAFYLAQPNSDQPPLKTNWIMQEYRLSHDHSTPKSNSSTRKKRTNHDYTKWVVCRVYERSSDSDDDDGTELSCLDEVFLSLDDLDEISLPKYS